MLQDTILIHEKGVLLPMTRNTFDSFFRFYKKKGFEYTLKFVQKNPEYKQMFTKAIALSKAGLVN